MEDVFGQVWFYEGNGLRAMKGLHVHLCVCVGGGGCECACVCKYYCTQENIEDAFTKDYKACKFLTSFAHLNDSTKTLNVRLFCLQEKPYHMVPHLMLCVCACVCTVL